eukprot:TRINITY_DN972_c0_g1_i1.p1 TRINITY_DN972_c0_g1~~TRINITY_DN972_c0_g1_i1.p1  ORF type:complete len:349 (-),score=58.50 TRINITY_DN972_c0_g1_i1:342-1388(-)
MLLSLLLVLAVLAGVAYLCFHRGKKLPADGCVFVVGADTGMGEITAYYLAKQGYVVFAGVHLPASLDRLKVAAAEFSPGCEKRVIPVQLDITSSASIAAAAKQVEQMIAERSFPIGLIATVHTAGVAIIGPAEYLPIARFRTTLDVNVLGHVETTQAFLPLIQKAVMTKVAGKWQAKKDRHGNSRHGRCIYFGTGGGVPAPSPGLLAPYMISKWGLEAFCQCLRIEMELNAKPIEAVMINPGFVKPTQLFSNGQRELEATWGMMPPIAKAEYSRHLEGAVSFILESPGTHRLEAAIAVEKAIADERPALRYFVGWDSFASPLVGLLPTALRHLILRHTFNRSTGTIPK